MSAYRRKADLGSHRGFRLLLAKKRNRPHFFDHARLGTSAYSSKVQACPDGLMRSIWNPLRRK
jgi:hypothetical protein